MTIAANAEHAQLVSLKTAVRELETEVETAGQRLFTAWAPAIARPEFLPGVRNLADYLALRQHDLTDLQTRLAWLGLSSLGRAEAHVRPSLWALSATLGRLTGEACAWPDPDCFRTGRAQIAAAQARLFGPAAHPDATRILVTLPTEAADNPRFVASLVAAGAGAVRINCAHDDAAIWARMIDNVRAAATEAGRPVPVLMDLSGPKVRITAVHAPDARLKLGDRFRMVRSRKAFDGRLWACAISFPHILDRCVPDASVLFDDGKIGARVIRAEPEGLLLEVTAVRAKGDKLKPEKGVNFPGLKLDLAPLTPDDMAALDFVAEHADIVGYSFVQCPADVDLLVDALAARRGSRPRQALMLKIETPRAVQNLPRLLVAAGGRHPVAVMIARGDLAMEVGPERLSEVQEEILWLCEAAHVPVVWATQVLESLVKEGMPSRAEVTDAAMAQRAECVMLNKGPFVVEGVTFLAGILRRMDRHQFKKSARLSALASWTGPQTQGAG